MTSRSIFFPNSLSASSKSCSDCNPIQKAADVPKNLAKRSAVSAVILLLDLVISVSLEAGIPVALDTEARDNSIGRMNSSSRISPGWIRGKYFVVFMALVVIYNFYCMLQTILPTKNDSPLLVDAYTPITFQITTQLFKSVTGWNSEILNGSSLIDHS